MPPSRALLCAALLVESHSQTAGEADSTVLLQSPLRRSQTKQNGVHLLETAKNLVSMVNSKDDPSACGAASDATRTALEEVLPAITQQHEHLSNQIRIAAEAVEHCGTHAGDLEQQGNDVQMARADHRTCRLAEHDLEGGVEACREYEVLRASLANRCFPFPDDEGEFPQIVQQARDELDEALNQALILQERCSTAREALAEQRVECSAAQHKFEEDFCVLRASCAGVQACRASAEAAFREIQDEALAALEVLRSEYQVLKHVECLLGHADEALEQSTIVGEDEVGACSVPANTGDLNIDVPTLAEAITCESNIILRPPCQEDFVQAEYNDLPQKEAIEAACAECPALQLDIIPDPDPPPAPPFIVPPPAPPPTNIGRACWDECGQESGLCEFCGSGNACCRENWDRAQPAECSFALHSGDRPSGHECVQVDVHLGNDAENFCSTDSVGEDRCLVASQALLPEGQTQGRTTLVVGSWAHLPGGCSVFHEGDWAAHFNRQDGSNDGRFKPVCTGPAAINQVAAHLEPEARNICSTESVSEVECLEAGQLVLPEGAAFGRTSLVVGSWNHLPPGCSLFSGGDWAAHYNRLSTGSNDGRFAPVCTGPETTSFPVVHLEPEASNACSTTGVSERQCLEASRLLLPEGQRQNRINLVVGEWAHLPVGCSLFSGRGGDWATHFNRRNAGSNDGRFSLVCSGPEATSQPVAHLEAEASNACSTASFGELECLEASRLLVPQGTRQGRINLVVGNWNHLPAGCSLFTGRGGDWATHYNRQGGSNDGRFSPVCTGPAPTSQLVAHLETEASNACSTASISEAECLEASRIVLPSGRAQGRINLVVGNWNHLPAGCSVFSGHGGDWAAHFNRQGGSNDGRFSPVCAGRVATSQLVAQLSPLGSNECNTETVNEPECLEAVRYILPRGQAQGRHNLVVGSWAHLSAGCSVFNGAGGDWAAHYNRLQTGNNDGRFSPVCTVLED